MDSILPMITLINLDLSNGRIWLSLLANLLVCTDFFDGTNLLVVETLGILILNLQRLKYLVILYVVILLIITF